MGNEFVYCVISQRAGGLSIGINMNPDGRCNFDCVYCEVDRSKSTGESRVNVPKMAVELKSTLSLAGRDGLRELLAYRRTPPELLEIKEVALSGDGEPTLCPNFLEVVEAVTHVRAHGGLPFFKIVLITNCTGLHMRQVEEGIGLLTSSDEIWAKLDAGTQAYMDRVNRPEVSIEDVVCNIVRVGRNRSIVIQSLFPCIDESGPSDDEIDAYIGRLKELRQRGAQIERVQVYSAHRPPRRTDCGHLPLQILSTIARRVQLETGLRAEVY